MATSTLTSDIMDMLGKLQQNYTALAQYWYDIFYESEPKKISFDYFDETGEKVVVSIDNLAMIRLNLKGIEGEGAPTPDRTATFGTIYHDVLNGELYKYVKDDTSSSTEDVGYWTKIISADVLDTIIISDDDPINNDRNCNEGTLLLSRDTKRLYLGRDGHWDRIDAAQSSVTQEVFKVTSGDESLVNDGHTLEVACESKNSMDIYVDGVLLSPSKYYIDNNGFQLYFTEPLRSPEAEQIEVIVKYYTNLSIFEDYWEEEEINLDDGTVVTHKHFKFAKDLFEQIENITSRINELSGFATNLDSVVENLRNNLGALQREMEEIVNTTIEKATQKVEVIETTVMQEKAAITDMHNNIDNYYRQVAQLRDNVQAISLDIRADVQWLRDTFADEHGDIDLNRFVSTDAYNNKISEIETTIRTTSTEITNDFNVKISDIETNVRETNRDIANINTSINGINNRVSNLGVSIENAKNELRNECFSDSNFPIGFYEPCKVGTVLEDFVKEHVSVENNVPNTKYSLGFSLMRDCSYYIMDLTSDLETAGNNRIYKGFNIVNTAFNARDIKTIDNGRGNSTYLIDTRMYVGTGLLENLNLTGVEIGSYVQDGDYILVCIPYLGDPVEEPEFDPENPPEEPIEPVEQIIVREDNTFYEIGTEFNLPEVNTYSFRVDSLIQHAGEGAVEKEDTYLIQVRVLLRNKSQYVPRILWENSNISWFGDEEPDFEPKTTYLLEFVSYDYGESWFAHTLGICQPSIKGDTVERLFKIQLLNYTASNLGEECDVFYDKEDGKTYFAGTYIVDNGGVIKDVALTFAKKELGDSFSNFRIHMGTDDLFVKHAVNGYSTLVDDAINEETVSADLDIPVTEVHEYRINLVSDSYQNDTYEVSLAFTSGMDTEVISIADASNIGGTISVSVNSDDNLEVFTGAMETVGTTPWKLVDVRVNSNNPIEPESYAYIFKRTLKLDEPLTLYVEKTEV